MLVQHVESLIVECLGLDDLIRKFVADELLLFDRPIERRDLGGLEDFTVSAGLLGRCLNSLR